MDNLSVVTSLCTAICSSFYPDKASVKAALFNAEIPADQMATPKDKSLLRVAVVLVKGYVESSRAEGGTSVSVDPERVNQSIRNWCKYFGANIEEITDDDTITTIEDVSHLW